MSHRIFTALPSRCIADKIRAACERVVYAAPGVTVEVAEAILAFAQDEQAQPPQVVLDCNADVCHLGYGEIQAVRLLAEGGVQVRQSPGLRIGILICDENAWCFSPVALCVEDEAQSDETPNAVYLMPQQAQQLVQAICPDLTQPSPFDRTNPFNGDDCEIGVTPLQPAELTQVEHELEIAPPLKFDVTRRVRVFQPYIQYVELSLQGFAISRRKVELPSSIMNLGVSEEMRERIRTTYDLISANSQLSDKPLQDELNRIREQFTKPLGKPWGRVLLRQKRESLDKELEKFRGNLEQHKQKVQEKLATEIEESQKAIIQGCLSQVMESPPPELANQIMGAKPTCEQAKAWLQDELDHCFPTADDLIGEMKLECTFRDVTYETLNEKGFREALRKAFPYVEWDKPFSEFETAKAEGSPPGE